jgi:copper transport protein
VIAVLPVAFMLRRSSAAGKDGSFKGWLRADAVLLAGIITVTGIFTHVSPLPDREPLHWHVMGETIHMTADLAPNWPGPNDLTVLVWVPEGEEAPAEVSAGIRNAQGSETTVILEPKEANEDKDAVGFPGFVRFDYKWKLRLKHPDQETLIVTVQRANGEKKVYEKTLSD